MKWPRRLIAALVLGTIAMVGLAVWQITSAPSPVPKVQVVRVPVPVTTTHYYVTPAQPVVTGHQALTTGTTGRPTPTTQAPPTPTTTRPTSPCLAVPLVGCLP
jgi:hypothetical protein